MFLGTSNLNRSGSVPITSNPQLDNIESDFHGIFIGKLFFTIFSGIILNPILSVWYYHLPFLSKIKTQVASNIISSLAKVCKCMPKYVKKNANVCKCKKSL